MFTKEASINCSNPNINPFSLSSITFTISCEGILHVGYLLYAIYYMPPPRPPPPRHNFVVSAITFLGYKLRSSNLTHALFIQISRTSSITDIVVQSKMAASGHFVKKLCIDLKWQEL